MTARNCQLPALKPLLVLSTIAYALPFQNIPARRKIPVLRRLGNKAANLGVLLQMEDPAPTVESTFEQIMLPHLDAAYNLAWWLLRHEQDAQDAVQDAFVRAFRSFERFRGGDGRGWLLTIVRNVCYTRLREGRRAIVTETFDDDAHSADDDPSEANAVAWREVHSALLQQALEQLAPEFREVIVLHELEGLAYKDIAAVVGVPMGTVMSRLARARQKLQAELRTLTQKEAGRGL